MGFEVKGRNGNSIFLPFAGYRNGLVLYKVGEFGYYWSSTPDNSYYEHRAYSIYGYRSSYNYERCIEVGFNYERNKGLTIRPVTD